MTNYLCSRCSKHLENEVAYCDLCSIVVENSSLREQLKSAELNIRNQTVQIIAEFIKNNHKNNIYWKWASNDIVDALANIKW